MRELKFRAWYFGKKEMAQWIDLVENPIWFSEILKNNSPYIILMQFTGLKDSLGNDIYESDIVRCLFHEPVDEVKKYVVEWDNEEAMFLLKNDIGSSVMNHRSIELTVIGNIYTNPELIL